MEKLQLVQSFNQRGEWSHAASLCREILSGEPDNVDALAELGIAMGQSGDAGAALAAFTRGTEIAPQVPNLHFLRAQAFRALGSLPEAVASFSAAIERAPDDFEAYFHRGNLQRELRQPQAALASYRASSMLNPQFAPAHFNFGVVALEQHNFEAALASFEKVLNLTPQDGAACAYQGIALLHLKRYTSALDSFERAIALQPDVAEHHSNRGNLERELGRFGQALQSYDKAIALQPGYAEAHCNRAHVLRDLNRLDESLAAAQTALDLRPSLDGAHVIRGNLQADAGRWQDALESFDRAVSLNPAAAHTWSDRSVALRELRRLPEALESLEQAIVLDAQDAQALGNRGNVLRDLGRYQEALESYDRALALKPDSAETYSNRGNALRDLHRFQAALDSYDRALKLSPGLPETYANRALALQEMGQMSAALDNYARALALQPNFAGVLQNRGNALFMLGDYRASLEDFERAGELDPKLQFMEGLRLLDKLYLSDWQDFDAQLARLEKRVLDGEADAPPFSVLALSGSAAVQRRAAEIWIKEKDPPSDELGRIEGPRGEGRLRVGYFSMDFREHPVSRLLVEVLESHDKERFEVYGFGWGEPARGALSERVRGAFEHFIDVQERSDLEVAKLARQLGLDVAVDLGGFTQGCRPRIFALRAAPVQVSYLGYLGTSGAPYMDYLLADATLIPESHQQHYQEKIVYLPSYQANDSKREISSRHFSREELGLPREGFVYCCFNASYKITPKMFDSWMRIVSAVEGSVLYLYASDEPVQQRLRAEAERRGVSGQRLVFGQTLPLPEYLARYREADLFLDTLPYNAGTTASDALWAGLPVLTCLGESLAARMAGSLLNALELPELITQDLGAYEARAIELARDPQQLQSIREKLERQRSSARLFDTERFTRSLEQAFTLMLDCCRESLPTDHLHVRQ